jgi:large subunit ribosomal protein L24
MSKAKILKGDKVLIIAGKDRGKSGVVERVMPSEQKLLITGLNMVKKHLKKSAKNPQGGVIDVIQPIHISNVMLLDPNQNKPTRVGYSVKGNDKHRIAKLSGEIIRGEK